MESKQNQKEVYKKGNKGNRGQRRNRGGNRGGQNYYYNQN